GIIQGLTEFLPVSSSGHLEIGHNLLGIKNQNNLLFAVVVHSATVLSTMVIFRKDISKLITGLFSFKWNDETKYIAKLLISSIPVIIIGLIFQNDIKALFSGNLIFVGSMLIVTALLLLLSKFAKKKEKKVSFSHAVIIGIAQTLAVLPGISRSGATIATGLILGNHKEGIARFSFLMVLIPILGALFYSIINGELNYESQIGVLPLIIGFCSAFISGLIACKWMISLVKKGKLIYFAIYCFIIGLIAIFAA
ncbi:MAG: undecaprenyl-diphosphate phosphatase, partial [Mariniphaga sp.]|nr:undecaprenyl-diphosphate phosphatase [Mariniphaga sp.]